MQVFEALERTSQGSESTHTFFFGRKLMCNAILQHFKITLFCGRINCPRIPFALFLLPYPLEQLEFIRKSNFQQNAISCHQLVLHNVEFSRANNNVDIDDNSLTQNSFLNSVLRDDHFINSLVSEFTLCMNFMSV